MASSDDEAEEVPSSVSQYYFEDDKAEPISFAVLPVWWSTNDAAQKSSGMKIYVRGKSGDGIGNLYKIVKAWKFDISGVKPEISVLHEKNWITLQRPRKSYEEFSRTVLITVNFLHLVKRYPELLEKDLWDRMSKIFSSLDGRPSIDDLVDHKALIEKAVERDDSLKKSKYFMLCLEKKLQKINKDPEIPRSKGKNAFIVEDDDLEEGGSLTEKDGSLDGEDGSDDEEEGDDDIFDSVCSICDEGGSILCCDGICMRSFHATLRAAKEADSKCKSLGFSTKEVEAMQTFKCQNCQHKQHQCYSCGVLGSSDKESGAAEVFQCFNATCGYFYHPSCVAKQLHRSDEEASNALQKDISAGEPFTCPLHLCFACRQPEDRIDPELRMAVCRRCPKAYHKKCLPRKIAFEDDEDDEDVGVVQRAWDNLLAGRILIYCLKHEIDEDLGTPLRNHIIFPGDAKREIKPLPQRIMKHKVLQKNKKPSVAPSRAGPACESKRNLLDKHPSDRKISKPQGTDTLRNMSSEKMTDRKISKPQGTDTLGNVSSEKKPISTKVVLKNPEGSDLVKPKTIRKITVEKSVVKLDSESETRILKFMEEASSKITLDDVIRKHETLIPSRVFKQKMDPCRSITYGKVRTCTKSVQAAVRKLDAGGSIEEAKAMCEPKILDQLTKWKGKLKVYLAPFIYGMRYTSFGRHFTQETKLKEIVEKVHWYINSNDTIVDFCCGANDFSRLMKEKLESTGKTCNYRNYDLFRPKDDFNFEKRDWTKVQPKELPTGAQLIIGLNPPFGVNASLANQFINKALEFKPKLVILIVPAETERLDKKKLRYDLIWEDRNRLSGKSFYLPGSVDIYDKQMEDWNVKPPILYLWSRHDWTTKHKAVAKEHGHLQEDEGNHVNRRGIEGFSEKLEHVTETKAEGVSAFVDEPELLKETIADEKQTSLKDQLREVHKNSLPENKNVSKDSRKKRPSEEIYTKEDIGSSWEHKRSRSPYYPHQGWPRQSPVNAGGGTLSPPIRYQTSPPNFEMMDPGRAQFEPTSYRDGRYPLDSQPRGFEDFPLDNMEMQGPSHDHLDRSRLYGGMRSGYTNPVGRYDDRVHDPLIDIPPGGRLSVDAGPHAGYPSRGTPYVPDYPPQISGEWGPDYMRGSGSHVPTHPYSEPGQRFRPSAFSMESSHGRRGSMSVMDSYGPRLDQPNYGTRSSYDPGHGPLPDTSRYNQGYPGGPMGFASRPSRDPYQHPHSSSGGWIND